MPSTKLSVSHDAVFLAVKFGYLLCPVWDLKAYLQSALHEHLIDCLRLCNKYFLFFFFASAKISQAPTEVCGINFSKMYDLPET